MRRYLWYLYYVPIVLLPPLSLLAEKGHKYEYTATLMYSNVGDVRFDEIDGVTVNGVSVDYRTAEDDNILNIYVPYDAYIEVRNCVEVVHGNQRFIF